MNRRKKCASALVTIAFLLAGSTIFALPVDSVVRKPYLHGNTIRPFQISFIPFFGTNGAQSGEFINCFSLNILAGYSGGVNGFELGGLVNMDRYDVNACQIAGIGNLVAGSTRGFQCGGIFNLSRQMTGSQVAGILNRATDANGVQISGLTNLAEQGRITQIAGLTNATRGTSRVQIAGLSNTCSKNEAIQIAGLANIAKEAGNQISGLVNIATHVKGVQIGVINIADTCDGIPIGVINIVKNGYRRFEVSADEFFQANLAYRSGVMPFHTIVTAGIQPYKLVAPLWTYGGGIGTSRQISEKMMIDCDVTFHHVIKQAYSNNNHLYRLYIGMEQLLGAKAAISIGVTYNFLATNLRQVNYESRYSDITPYSFTNESFGHTNLKTWAGFKIGLRLL